MYDRNIKWPADWREWPEHWKRGRPPEYGQCRELWTEGKLGITQAQANPGLRVVCWHQGQAGLYLRPGVVTGTPYNGHKVSVRFDDHDAMWGGFSCSIYPTHTVHAHWDIAPLDEMWRLPKPDGWMHAHPPPPSRGQRMPGGETCPWPGCEDARPEQIPPGCAGLLATHTTHRRHTMNHLKLYWRMARRQVKFLFAQWRPWFGRKVLDIETGEVSRELVRPPRQHPDTSRRHMAELFHSMGEDTQ